MKKLVLGSLAYLVSTFTLAIVWHIGLFGDIYFNIGYIAKENPNFVLGFLSILLQGIIMTAAYQFFFKGKYCKKKALAFALITGVFFWTSHVLAFVAKQPITNIPLFMGLESFYLLLQFGIYGLALGLIYKGGKK